MSLPKEREKCLGCVRNDFQYEPVNEANLKLSDQKPSEEEQKFNWSEITPKSIAKCFLGLFVLGSLLYTIISLYSAAQQVLLQKSECSQLQYANAALVFCIFAIPMYLYFRDACVDLLEEAASTFADLFSPVDCCREFWKGTIVVLWQMIQIFVITCFMQWSTMTLIYGTEMSSNLLKNSDQIREMSNETKWIQNRELASSFFEKYFLGVVQTQLMSFVVVTTYLAMEEHEQRNGIWTSKNLSRALWLFRRVYGKHPLMSIVNFVCFSLLVDQLALFAVFEGWITRDFCESLSSVPAFFLITLPTYAIFFALCAATELFVYWIHLGRDKGSDGSACKAENHQAKTIQLPFYYPQSHGTSLIASTISHSGVQTSLIKSK